MCVLRTPHESWHTFFIWASILTWTSWGSPRMHALIVVLQMKCLSQLMADLDHLLQCAVLSLDGTAGIFMIQFLATELVELKHVCASKPAKIPCCETPNSLTVLEIGFEVLDFGGCCFCSMHPPQSLE